MNFRHSLCLALTLLSIPLSSAVAAAPENRSNTTTSSRPSSRSIREQAKQRRWQDDQRSRYTYDAGLSQLYLSDLFGFTIRYPRDWTAQEVLDRSGTVITVVLFLSPLEQDDISQENINLVVEDISGTYQTLDDYTNNAIIQEQELFSGYTLHSSVSLQIEGFPAHTITYDALFGGKILSFEQVWILKNGKVYVWTLAAPPETFNVYSKQFRRMIEIMVFQPAFNH